MRLIYRGATGALAPLLRWHLARRARRGKEDAGRLAERFGIERAARPAGRLLWVHAASVGEAVSVLPVLQALPAEMRVLFTTGTVTSAELLARRLPELGLGRVMHRYVPLDVPGWAGRFLDHWRPDAACFVESEIWPNLLLGCDARGIARVLVNARLSVRSLRWWRRVPGFARDVFGGFGWVAAQSEVDAHRLRAVGAGAVSVLGNLKFAAAPLAADEAELARLRAEIGEREVFLAASTRAGEEAAVLDAHRALRAVHPDLLTIIVPRHPERGAEIAAMGGFARRSLGQGPGGEVWVGDTLGEMGLYYRLARVVFVGGSLVPAGGQNPLEAARLGCAVAMGPHGFNNAEPIAALAAAGALRIVSDAAELADFVGARLADPAGTDAMGAAGAATASRAAEAPGLLAARLAALVG